MKPVGVRGCDLCRDGRGNNRLIVHRGEPGERTHALCDDCLAEAERHTAPVVEVLDFVSHCEAMPRGAA